MSVDLSLLGKETQYPKQYAPDVLFPITRAESRQAYADIPHIHQGMDWWHVFELSWLNGNRQPQVAIARLHIPASSPYLIESKSLKLYFNSLNFKSFHHADELVKLVEQDLSKAAQTSVKVELFSVDDLKISQPDGICIDHLSANKIEYQPNAKLLALENHLSNDKVEELLYSHLLRSNCPVTNQPDWGTVFIRYQGQKISHSALLSYIISYREHNGFHEQCVEHIFADIWRELKPEKLMVYACYTRRGGLDINPCRTSDLNWLVKPIRLARQ